MIGRDKPFIRVFELRLNRVGKPPFLKILADGSRDNLRISFSIKKQLLPTLNEHNIIIYNMKKETRQILMQPNLQAKLFVGWKNIQSALLASGDVVLAIPSKEVPTNQMTLTLLDGLGGVSDTVKHDTYLPDTSMSDVVFNIASSMTGISIDKNKINVDGQVKSKGYTVSGRPSEELNKLSNTHNFTWSIQNGVFQAIKDGISTGNKYLISSESGNLFSAIPQFQDPSQVTAAQIQTGIEIRAFIQPKILPGDIVTLDSKFISKMYNGDYTVHNIGFDGDSNGNVNEMKIESIKYKA